MKNKTFYSIFFISILISLFVIPFYSFFEYFCYTGLCGGWIATRASQYSSFFGYFFWSYFLITIVVLFVSKIFFKKNRVRMAFLFLCIPIFFLIPYAYVEYKIMLIEQEYAKMQHT